MCLGCQPLCSDVRLGRWPRRTRWVHMTRQRCFFPRHRSCGGRVIFPAFPVEGRAVTSRVDAAGVMPPHPLEEEVFPIPSTRTVALGQWMLFWITLFSSRACTLTQAVPLPQISHITLVYSGSLVTVSSPDTAAETRGRPAHVPPFERVKTSRTRATPPLE